MEGNELKFITRNLNWPNSNIKRVIERALQKVGIPTENRKSDFPRFEVSLIIYIFSLDRAAPVSPLPHLTS